MIEGWAKLGIQLDFGQPRRDYDRSHNCFALATSADLVDAQGRKVIGSAQLRRSAHLLQHGSMGLATNSALWQQVFQTPAAPPSEVQIAVQHGLALTQIISSLTQAAETCFERQFIPQPLTQREWAEIHALAQKNGQKNGPGCQSAGPSAVSSS